MAFTTKVTYRASKQGLDQVLHDRNGPVALYTANVGRQAAGAARRRVGVKIGRLKASIRDRLVRSSRGSWNVEISATAPWALYHHEGTRPHPIVPRNASVLVFEVGGVTVFTRHVNHPGSRGNPFLREALRDVGLQPRRR